MSTTFLFMTSTYQWKLMVMIQPNTTQVSNSQLYGISNSSMFNNITMFTYIIPVKCISKHSYWKKIPCKWFWFCHGKHSKNKKYIYLWKLYYMLQNQKNKIIQTALKYYNQLRSVRSETLIWLQITTGT